MPSRYADHVLTGTFAARPAATAVPAGTLYSSTTDGTVYQSNGTVWATWLAAPAAAGVVQLADTTLGAPAASIDLTSISGAYKHLRLVLMGRGTTSGTNELVYLRFNNDTAANYDWSNLRGTNSAASSSQGIADTAGIWLGTLSAATAPANVASSITIDIPSYAATTFEKTLLANSGDKRGLTAALINTYLFAGWWRSTAAINRITVRPGANNFAAGTQATLYGMN